MLSLPVLHCSTSGKPIIYFSLLFVLFQPKKVKIWKAQTTCKKLGPLLFTCFWVLLFYMTLTFQLVSTFFTQYYWDQIMLQPSWVWQEKTCYHYNGLSIFLLELVEVAPIYHAHNHLPYIKWLVEVCPNYPMKLGCRIEWVLWDSQGLGKCPCGLLALCSGDDQSWTYSHFMPTSVA